MSIIRLTTMEALAVEEALDYAKDELQAAEEQTDYVLTSGAMELIAQALVIMRKANKTSFEIEEEELELAYQEKAIEKLELDLENDYNNNEEADWEADY